MSEFQSHDSLNEFAEAQIASSAAWVEAAKQRQQKERREATHQLERRVHDLAEHHSNTHPAKHNVKAFWNALMKSNPQAKNT